ncbi:MAG: thioredoxin family protein [Candidatus Eisenbacteria bacterium]
MQQENEKTTSRPAQDDPSGSRSRRSHPFWRWFWLSFLVLSLGYAWYSFYVPSNDIAWAEDIVSAKQRAAETNQPMLLFFTADWCVPCRIMKREVFSDRDVTKALNARFVPVMVYEGEPGGDEAFRHYNVGGTPITIFTDSEGHVLDYAVGRIGKAEFLEMLEGVVR